MTHHQYVEHAKSIGITAVEAMIRFYRHNPPCEWCFTPCQGVSVVSPSYAFAGKHLCSWVCVKRAENCS